MLEPIKNIWNKFTHKPASSPVPLNMAERAEGYKKDVRDKSYKFAVIALGTKLAQADGEINEKEIKALSGVFSINIAEDEIRSLINDAGNDKVGFEHYASIISTFFPGNRNLFDKVTAALFDLAVADSPINREEMKFLKGITEVFKLSNDVFINNIKRFIIPAGSSPYEVMSVSKNITEPDLKKAYRDAIQAYHPDKFSSFDKKGEIITAANQRINMISNAYNSIKNQKKFK